MRVCFSSPHPFNGDGPGRPFTRIHEALKAKYGDSYTSFSPVDFPELSNGDGLGHGRGPAFDDLAGEAFLHGGRHHGLGVFVGGGGSTLHQGRFARALGDAHITLWFSSHWANAERVLREEYARFGITDAPIHSYVKWRAAKEQAESDVLIVPSEYCRGTYPKQLQAKVRVAEFGVNLEEFKVNGDRKRTDRLQVLVPASNPIRKGIPYILEAVKGLDPKSYDVTVTGGWQMPAQPLTRVHTPGWVSNDQMKVWYRGHDVLLLPSLEEGLALSSLEGAASGMALIVTPEVGLPITDGKEGLVVPSRDAGAIRKALQYFIDNSQEVERMGREARAFAEKRPWSFFTDKIIQIIENAKED